MQIMIDIDENLYTRLFDNGNTNAVDMLKACVAIRKGKPLPKGHGDLVDRNKINDRFYDIWKELESYSNKPTYKELLDKWNMCLDTEIPIIEADTESEGQA